MSAAAQPLHQMSPRRDAGGPSTARGLLLTVLGQFLLATGGHAWTASFIDVLGRCGVEEKAARQALMRTAARGWLSAERTGRRTRWALTGSGSELLSAGAERIYAFADAAQPWDGRWLLVLARVTESDRSARHVLRTRLSWAGFGSLGSGLWISPHPARLDEAQQVLAQAGVGERAAVFVAARAPGGDVRGMAAQAWDLDAVDASYEQFVADFSSDADRDPIERLVALVHAWRRFPLVDPGLPGELLPAHWSGLAAAQLFATRREQWTPAALRAWQELEARRN